MEIDGFRRISVAHALLGSSIVVLAQIELSSFGEGHAWRILRHFYRCDPLF